MKYSSDYEKIFATAEKAIEITDKLADLLAVLRPAEKPMTCREIGIAIMGDAYTADNWRDRPKARSLAAYVGRVCALLKREGLVEISEIDGEPVTYEDEEWVNLDGTPEYLTVHDADGNEYRMRNPKYDRWASGKWQKVPKTVVPKVKVYKWVGD